ncbi:MAG: DUF6320 domain-containing protein [Eubacteriales bacterium]|nr:DUF6320 domain-containing protein [Eubacteriales bacterium]
MQYCNRCRMEIRGYKRCCPLCGSLVTGEGERPCFPTIRKKKVSYVLFQKVCLYILIMLFVSMILVRNIIGEWRPWMWLVIFCGIVGFMDVMLMRTFRQNTLKTVHLQGYTGILLCIIVDHYTGSHGWAYAWVVPIAFVILMFAAIMTALILKIALRDFTLYLAFDTLMTFVQLLPIHAGKNIFPLPAQCSMAIVVLAYGALLIFGWRAFHSAAGRFFNV